MYTQHHRVTLIGITITVLLSPCSSLAQSLSIVTEQGSVFGCQYVDFTPFVTVQGWIQATSAPGQGILGAELMVQLPPNVVPLSVTPNPAATVTGGSPFSEPMGGGGFILFGECQTPATGSIVLYSFTLLSIGATGAFELPIVEPTNPTNPNMDCAVVLNCASQFQCAPQTYQAYVGPAANPFPANLATAVSVDVDLTWDVGAYINCGCAGTPYLELRFGTTPDPPTVYGFEPIDTFDPGTLAEGTTYYWRVYKYWCGAEAWSPLWSFTTEPTVSVEHPSWSAVKGLFR